MNKTAFIFAGQGAQAVGMGMDLYEHYNCAKDIFDMSAEIKELCFNGPKEELDVTKNTQPAVFLTGLACAAVLSEKGIVPNAVAGFSLGEITAACYAGFMSNEQAFEFVKHRAQAMQECALKTKGTMFAILKLPNEKVQAICKSLIEAYPVNYNSPGQIVVACAQSTSDSLQQAVTEHGGKAIKLAVSGAFHSPFMDEASKKVEKYLENISLDEAIIPMYSNVTAQLYNESELNPKELLVKQINHPVLWQKTIENMIKDGIDTFIEAGPGKTLTGLIKKINPEVRTHNVSDISTLNKTIEELNNA
ncbi:MAG: ACP S-malonyltransferase [Oscillospiraceae bacterium]|nr:ACP S-malonyltransferase [Oscillospiraceae bacterium]